MNKTKKSNCLLLQLLFRFMYKSNSLEDYLPKENTPVKMFSKKAFVK